jgi:hypothetical protein
MHLGCVTGGLIVLVGGSSSTITDTVKVEVVYIPLVIRVSKLKEFGTGIPLGGLLQQ